MEASTPLIPSSDLRRQTLLRNAVNMSPLRRSFTSALNASLLEDSNDDFERLARRSNVQIQRRLSNIGDQDKAPLNESYIKKQFAICTHLFTENKITTKNAWKLEIIDLLKPICQKVSKDTLQVASTSIDISAKVYGIRVDDIHSDGLKLASSMARVSDKVPPQDADGEEGVVEENGQDQDRQTGSKKKKKKRPTGQKTTVTTTKATLGNLPKLEPVDFTTRVNADTGAIDNLFTNVLKEDNISITFAFVDKQMTFMSNEDPLVKNNSDAHVPISSLPPLEDVTNIHLNVPFSDFKLDEWDPEQEEKMLGTEKSMFTQSQGVAFDENGIPIPELDGSIPDIFENHMDEVHSDVDNDMEFVQETVAPQLHGEVAHIVDFRSINTTAQTAQTSEYSYNTIVNTRAGNYIDQIWAGPCHWKLKFIRRSSIRFSGARTHTAVALKHRRKKAPPEKLTYVDPEEIDFFAKLIIKKKPPTPDINKVTLPIKINIQFEETIDELMLKPETCTVEKKKIDENVEYEIGPYKYENPHDSFYCSQQDGGDDGMDAGDAGDDGHFDAENEEHVMAEQQNFLGENLVDLPQMVTESYIPFAMKAKQMDMKKLKAAIWQKLTNKTIILDAQSQRRSGNVIPTTFSEMYTHLPEVLAEKEKKELTCPLAFVALLHLCNEQNLALKQLPGYTDFQIKGAS